MADRQRDTFERVLRINMSFFIDQEQNRSRHFHEEG